LVRFRPSRRGLKGFPEAIASVYPQTVVQTYIVHLIRNSLAFVAWKDRKAILPAIKAIYRAENADMALVRLEEFEDEWGKRYPAIGQAWRRAWEHVVPFFAFAPGVRKMIYTTNAVEALHRSLRKIIKTRGSFPNDDAALKLLYLAIKNAGLRWRRGVEWTAAMGQFAIQFGSRFPGSARCGGYGLDRACCPATVSHHGFDDDVWLMQETTALQPSQRPLTQNIGHSP